MLAFVQKYQTIIILVILVGYIMFNERRNTKKEGMDLTNVDSGLLDAIENLGIVAGKLITPATEGADASTSKVIIPGNLEVGSLSTKRMNINDHSLHMYFRPGGKHSRTLTLTSRLGGSIYISREGSTSSQSGHAYAFNQLKHA